MAVYLHLTNNIRIFKIRYIQYIIYNNKFGIFVSNIVFDKHSMYFYQFEDLCAEFRRHFAFALHRLHGTLKVLNLIPVTVTTEVYYSKSHIEDKTFFDPSATRIISYRLDFEFIPGTLILIHFRQ